MLEVVGWGLIPEGRLFAYGFSGKGDFSRVWKNSAAIRFPVFIFKAAEQTPGILKDPVSSAYSLRYGDN